MRWWWQWRCLALPASALVMPFTSGVQGSMHPPAWHLARSSIPPLTVCVTPCIALQARENAAAGMFLELLFWKGANVAEDVRNEYNWRVRGSVHGRSFV